MCEDKTAVAKGLIGQGNSRKETTRGKEYKHFTCLSPCTRKKAIYNTQHTKSAKDTVKVVNGLRK